MTLGISSKLSVGLGDWGGLGNWRIWQMFVVRVVVI